MILIYYKYSWINWDGLQHISSQNEIHGDIKPNNLLLKKCGNELRACIADFGLSKKSGGSPCFTAPEDRFQTLFIENSAFEYRSLLIKNND